MSWYLTVPLVGLLVLAIVVLAVGVYVFAIRGFRRVGDARWRRRIKARWEERNQETEEERRDRAERRAQRVRFRMTLLLFMAMAAILLRLWGFGFFGWISSVFTSFPVAFVGLTLMYAAAIILFVLGCRVVQRLINRQPDEVIDLGRELKETLRLFVEKPVTVRRPTRNGDHEEVEVNLANNHRWYALVAMMVITWCLAWMYPGEGLFWSASRAVFGTAIGEEKAQHVWYFFSNGWFSPSNPDPGFVYEPRAGDGLIERWFFLKAAAIYTILVVVYFFFAFWDELMHLVHEVKEIIERKKEAVRQERQRKYQEALAAHRGQASQGGRRGRQQQATPPPAPPSEHISFKELFEVEILGEIASKILFGLFEIFWNRHKGYRRVR